MASQASARCASDSRTDSPPAHQPDFPGGGQLVDPVQPVRRVSGGGVDHPPGCQNFPQLPNPLRGGQRGTCVLRRRLSGDEVLLVLLTPNR